MSIRVLCHESEVLRGNPCGDPTERDLWVYLPPGYDDDEERRYPVLWCLVGYTGVGGMAVPGNHWAPGLPARLDRMIAAGHPPAIVAFPDCFTRWGGSQYLNSLALGRYEDYVCDELVPFVDRTFRTVASGPARGVFGKSSGGYGALRLAMRRPGFFGAVACHSGDMGFALSYLPHFGRCAAEIAKAGSIEELVSAFDSREKKSSSMLNAIMTLGMAAAYSPDPDKPLAIGLPFDLDTGELIPDVWRRWREHDPVEMVQSEQGTRALRGLRLLFLDCGSDDEYQLHLGMRLFLRHLDTLGIPYEAEEFPDDHRGISYRYEVSVPKLLAAVSTPSP